MKALEDLRADGWSYCVGWHQGQKSYLARAWKERERPHKTSQGVVLFLHSLSSTGETLDVAAETCAACVHRRIAGLEHESDYERDFIRSVASWRPR
jgi:hypothetical protein